MKTKKIFIIIVFISLLMTYCKKDDYNPPVSQKPQSMNELVASSTFNWKTTKDYQITLKGAYNDVVKITSSEGGLYHKGFMKSNANYTINLSLPSYETKIHLIYCGKDVECILSQNIINYTFNLK